ncbi:hypothetical protein SAMN05192549_1268 [Duganella sacchari]|uniref:Uncharacterized protein n=1 Tax=Duganella sacchari TaxID=551987 RepID=A0A1M7REQ5_9BURK|nr:hypothetical protein SAMN05192549_1268 [Duganella sacchari]
MLAQDTNFVLLNGNDSAGILCCDIFVNSFSYNAYIFSINVFQEGLSMFRAL